MEKDMNRHTAIVAVSTDLLLRLMEFQGGKIYKAYTNYEDLVAREVYLVIEHPDIPACNEYDLLPQINIILQTTCGKNGVPTKIERINPPKQS